jgi:hypothetical protein
LDELKGYLGVFLFGSNEIEVLNEFERHSRANRIKEKDISKYKNFKELNEQVKIAEDIEKQKEVEKQILKIHEDDTWLVLTPLSFEASRVYGSNPKWCTTQERYWDRYLKTHRLVYCINKKIDTKVAFSRDYGDDKFQAWTADDSEVSPMFIDWIPDEIFLKIRKELQKNERTIDLTDIKISEIQDDIVSRRDMAIRMWDGRHVFGGNYITGTTLSGDVIETISNDSRQNISSNEILTRIRTLMGTQPRQQLQPISPEPPSTQTISDRPNVNYTSTYDDYVRQFMGGSETYLDDLP